jgi:hypothetical protein
VRLFHPGLMNLREDVTRRGRQHRSARLAEWLASKK